MRFFNNENAKYLNETLLAEYRKGKSLIFLDEVERLGENLYDALSILLEGRSVR